MKTLLTLTLIGSLATAPLAMAQTRANDVTSFINIGTDYGISQFRSIEFDDDNYGDIELEGWMNDWYVELDISPDGTIRKEERRKSDREPDGLSAQDIEAYSKAASAEGMHTIEEITVDRQGDVEVEGEDQTGRELEIDFRRGELKPVRIKRDD